MWTFHEVRFNIDIIILIVQPESFHQSPVVQNYKKQFSILLSQNILNDFEMFLNRSPPFWGALEVSSPWLGTLDFFWKQLENIS